MPNRKTYDQYLSLNLARAFLFAAKPDSILRNTPKNQTHQTLAAALAYPPALHSAPSEDSSSCDGAFDRKQLCAPQGILRFRGLQTSREECTVFNLIKSIYGALSGWHFASASKNKECFYGWDWAHWTCKFRTPGY